MQVHESAHPGSKYTQLIYHLNTCSLLNKMVHMGEANSRNPTLSLQHGQQNRKKCTKNPNLWTNLSYRSSKCSSRHPYRPHVFNRQLIFGLDLRENRSEIENSGTWFLCRIGPFRSMWGIFTKFIAIWEKIVVLWNQLF